MFNDTYIPNNPLAVLKPEKEPRRYSLAEFLVRSEKTDDLLEYYDGIITKLPMARGPHNEITMNVATALNMTIWANNKSLRVFGGQQKVYLPTLNYGIFPDVLVVTDQPIYWDDNQVLLTNPILIIEILSRGTRKYDRTTKFSEYKTLSSFQEYLLIDQKKCSIEAYFKEKPNFWQLTDHSNLEDSIYLKSIDCTIALSDIYRNINFNK
jgi:Uma2 family endonuclease